MKNTLIRLTGVTPTFVFLLLTTAASAGTITLNDVLDKRGVPGDPAGITVLDTSQPEFGGIDDSFEGQVTLTVTITFDVYSRHDSFTFFQLGGGSRPKLALGNGWNRKNWGVFNGRDQDMPGSVLVKTGDPRSFTLVIDYKANAADTATVTMSGAGVTAPLTLRGDFSFDSVVLRSGNSAAATAADFTGMSISGIPKPERLTFSTLPPLAPNRLVLGSAKLRKYVDRFNADDEQLYANIPNKDAFSFLEENIPLFECPDQDFERTYYFRWWTYRKHVKKTPDGYVITEFLPQVSWSGKHNTISCPAAHHYYEGRWLRNTRYLDDYSVFWLRKGGEPRRYSFWIADAFMARQLVTPNKTLLIELLPDLVKNYAAWETGWKWGRHHLGQRENGLFFTIDDRDGGEVSIGGHGYRPTLNSFMYGDAKAIATISRMAGDTKQAERFEGKAAHIKQLVQGKLWDDEAQFFKILPAEGTPLVDVRELYGYTPWYFNLPDPGYEAGWKELMDPKGFYAPFGPTFAEQRHPQFRISYKGHECQWNGPSWPLATCSTLTALANLLNNYEQDVIGKQDYFETLKIYTKCHSLKRKDGKLVPWIDENLNPDTGDWIARTRLKTWKNGTWSARKGGKERGKDYNHSTYNDLIISGLVGLRPRADDVVEVNPLLPENSWDYFCLDNVRYHGRNLTILWDKDGSRYGKGRGLRVFADGKEIVAAAALQRVEGKLTPKAEAPTIHPACEYRCSDRSQLSTTRGTGESGVRCGA